MFGESTTFEDTEVPWLKRESQYVLCARNMFDEYCTPEVHEKVTFYKKCHHHIRSEVDPCV